MAHALQITKVDSDPIYLQARTWLMTHRRTQQDITHEPDWRLHPDLMFVPREPEMPGSHPYRHQTPWRVLNNNAATLLTQTFLDRDYAVADLVHVSQRYGIEDAWRKRIGAQDAGSLISGSEPGPGSAATKGRLFSTLTSARYKPGGMETMQLIVLLKGYQAFLQDDFSKRPHDFIAKDTKRVLNSIDRRLTLLTGELAGMINEGLETPAITRRNIRSLPTARGPSGDGRGR